MYVEVVRLRNARRFFSVKLEETRVGNQRKPEKGTEQIRPTPLLSYLFPSAEGKSFVLCKRRYSSPSEHSKRSINDVVIMQERGCGTETSRLWGLARSDANACLGCFINVMSKSRDKVHFGLGSNPDVKRQSNNDAVDCRRRGKGGSSSRRNIKRLQETHLQQSRNKSNFRFLL